MGPKGPILDIEEMAPFNDATLHRSRGVSTYVLEVGKGWLRQRQIGPGPTVSFTLAAGLTVR